MTYQSKWSKWADSQFGILDDFIFSPNFDLSVQMVENGLIPNSEFWTTLFSVQFMDYQSKSIIQWYRSKR